MSLTRTRPAASRTSMRASRPIASTGCVGTITDVTDDRLVILSGGATLTGRRAVSCLLEPVVGDTVSCVMVAPDEVWVLGILMREEGATNCLRLNGSTTLRIEGGELTLQAPGLNLRSDACSLNTRRLDVSTDEAEVVGRQFHLFGGAFKLVASVIDTVADRVAQFSKQYQRSTEGTDRVQAQVIDQDAKQLLTQSAEHVMLNGRRLIKARGAQIHFG